MFIQSIRDCFILTITLIKQTVNVNTKIYINILPAISEVEPCYMEGFAAVTHLLDSCLPQLDHKMTCVEANADSAHS